MGSTQSSNSNNNSGKDAIHNLPQVETAAAHASAAASRPLQERRRVPATRDDDDGTAAAAAAAFSDKSEKVEYHDPNRPEGGMSLVHYVCRKKKRTYDNCVKNWYSKEFMTGAGSLNQEEVCGEKFDAYKSCILKGIRKEVWDKQGLPPPAEGSQLAEVDEEN